MKKNLALFDFDGTITRKDTFLEVIKFSKGGLYFYAGTFILSPILVLYKLRLIPNWRAKEIFFSYFFGEQTVQEFQEMSRNFALQKLPSMIRPSAVSKIREHLNSSDRVIIVTASAAEWIRPWADQFGIELITTQWEISNGKLTGKIKGHNCYGPIKKELILELINPADYEVISVYGDTRGDKEMLSLGTAFFKYFKD